MMVKGGTEAWNLREGKFCHCFIVLEDEEHNYYHALFQGRRSEFTDAKMKDVVATLIPPSHLWPRVESGLTLATQPLDGCYIKKPNLIGYQEKSSYMLRDLLLKEARTCEVLKAAPHPNVAEYFGIVEDDGHIKGLCFAKYERTLSRYLMDGDRSLDVGECLRGIRSGIDHLHSLGLVHNDLNPYNIMLRSDNTPVIIDFDSCEKEGTLPRGKRGTPGWNEGASDLAVRVNDIRAIARIAEALEAVKGK